MEKLTTFISYKRKKNKSEKGMAIIESIPVLFMLVLVFNFSLGFFGAIHSGILNSIGSYNYTLETFRFRSNLVYFRPGGGITNYSKSHNRVHGTIQDGSEDAGDNRDENKKWPVTLRGITFNYKSDTAGRDLASLQDGKNGKVGLTESSHAYSSANNPDNVWFMKSKATPQVGSAVQTARVWVKTVYGICLNADCK